MRLWFFARLQARTPFLRRPDGVHLFAKRKADSLPDDIDSGDRPSAARGLRIGIQFFGRRQFINGTSVASTLENLVRIHVDRNMHFVWKGQFLDDRTDRAAETANRF